MKYSVEGVSPSSYSTHLTGKIASSVWFRAVSLIIPLGTNTENISPHERLWPQETGESLARVTPSPCTKMHRKWKTSDRRIGLPPSTPSRRQFTQTRNFESEFQDRVVSCFRRRRRPASLPTIRVSAAPASSRLVPRNGFLVQDVVLSA